MRLIKELKGGSLSKTAVFEDKNNIFVRKKISCNKNREYGLVRWQSQIRKIQILYKYLPKNNLPIINVGYEKDYYFFDIPYVQNSDNLYDALKKGVSSKKISSKIVNLLKLMVKKKYEIIKGSLSVYLIEEIKAPVLKAIIANKANDLKLSENERKIFQEKLIDSVKKIDLIIEKYKETSLNECLTHGNLTLENALWCYENENIIFIDPYAETYCESILGDISQLFQSSKSGYEFINQLNDNEYSINSYPKKKIPLYLKEFSNDISKKLNCMDWYSSDVIEILHASQFTRMFPFKIVNSPRKGALFMYHGLDLLKDIKC